MVLSSGLSTIYPDLGPFARIPLSFGGCSAAFVVESAQFVAVSVMTKIRIEFAGMLPEARLP